MSFDLLSKEWFARDALTVAKELLGKEVEYNGCTGMIVETEAYMGDPASHAFKITPRSEIILKTYGVIYVYFIYGNHFCLNFTTNRGSKGAVLIRALEPLKGMPQMQIRRGTESIKNLTSGPGKLCQAFGITRELNGTEVNEQVCVRQYQEFSPEEIGVSPRIGIKQATDLEWRFYIKENEFVGRR